MSAACSRDGLGILALAAAAAAAVSMAAPAPLWAAPGAGTLVDPFRIDAFPFAVADDTTGRPALIDAYACAPTLDEAGPEMVYALTTPVTGRLVAWVEGDVADTTDIDVHLLSSDTVTDGLAVDCVARANLAIEVDQLPAGDYFLVVDSYVSGGIPLPGPYTLRVDFIAYDEWRDRPVARGVTWRQKLYPDLFGYFQTANVLVLDPADPDLALMPVDGNGCETTGSMGARIGAVAAVNAGFFDGSCNPVGLLKIDGQLLATNSHYRVAFGVDDAGGPVLDWVAAGEDWPVAHQAIGGVPRLLSGGVVDLTWEAEGTTSSFTFDRHPRTAACIDSSGLVQLVTFDGRTAAGGGIGLDDLATWMGWNGCVDAMNYDGGGSTTMWIRGQPFGGVVNYPSDNGTADHLGSRAVTNAWAVMAAPYLHPPRFTTAPPLAASEGVAWAYDADALDLDVYDVLAFGLAAGPGGPVAPAALTLDPVTGEAAWTPGYRDGGPREIALTVTDGDHVVEQRFTVQVAVPDRDQDGLPDTWEDLFGTDPDTPDQDADPDGDDYSNAQEYAQGSDPLDPADPGPAPGQDGGLPAADSGDGTDVSPGSAGCGCRGAPDTNASSAPWMLLALLGLVVLLWRLRGVVRRRGLASP